MGRHKTGKGRSARKARAGQNNEALEEEYKQCPHSFIFNRGHVGKNINNLILDMRRVMEPFTASHLKARKSNVLKDFVSIAGTLNVSHFLTFSKTEISTYMRIMRLPRGPTLTFKLNAYSLSRDVVSSLKHHHMDAKQFQNHPLLILNKFSGEGLHLKLMSTMFQNLFPAIHVNKMKLNDIRRCVLLNYDPADKTLEFRHYNIRAVPVGLSRAIKKLVSAKVPDMSKFNDISEFVDRNGNASESEAEQDGPHNEVLLPQDVAGRGNMKSAKSAIRLTEIGPRMKLQLIKIEEGLCEGNVLFHEFVQKTEEEKASLHEMRARKKKVKELRRQQQDTNVQKKAAAREEAKKKTLEGMKKAEKKTSEEKQTSTDGKDEDDLSAEELTTSKADEEDDDDAEYYRQEVGEQPDPEMFPARKNRGGGGKRPFSLHRGRIEGDKSKRRRMDNNSENDKRPPWAGGSRGSRGRDSAGSQMGHSFRGGHSAGRGGRSKRGNRSNAASRGKAYARPKNTGTSTQSFKSFERNKKTFRK